MAARKKKSTELATQSDPKAELDRAQLLKRAEVLLKELAEDLLERAKDSASVAAALQSRHSKEKAAERTADNYDTWLRNFTEQVGAAWFLSAVFVRTLEDRGLLERARLAGPGAMDSQRAFFALAPSLSERDYLLTVFRELCHLPAAEALFDARHNPVWLLGPSAEAARKLLEFFRSPNAETPAFRFGGADTRFLGDLYQDLSENVRKRYALLQTPRFVESFILDRTLTPALERFGLEATTLIDPTCGSGHFLLGAFERLFDAWLKQEPAKGERSAATKALAAVRGADINPYAVAIARFRLTLAFLEKGGFTRLKDAPKLPLGVVVADSLLHNPQVAQLELGDVAGQSIAAWKGSDFVLEDEAGAREVLYQRYAAVVGNPPYITVKDAVLRDRYRKLYSSAFREYSLAVPFKERFFQLACARGFVGMITANSFMKREFGKKVIQEYLPTVNLTSIVNTSGAYIPGHGTPTVLLFGSSEPPQDGVVHTVLANRGEPATPENAEEGQVWSSIARCGDKIGFENDYISVVNTERSILGRHPWSLGGGGASELKALLEDRADRTLGELVDCIGFGAVTREDDVYQIGRGAADRAGIPAAQQRPLVSGEAVRDWALVDPDVAIWPYDPATLEPVEVGVVLRALWPWRAQLSNRVAYGKTQIERGLPWYAYSMFFADRFRTPLSITFAFVATHNHFVLDRGGKVFKQSAPIIKLPADATEDDHYSLLAYLNSSTACFLLKQVCSPKGMQNGSESNATSFLVRFEFDGTKLAKLPLPKGDLKALAPFGKAMHELAKALRSASFEGVVADLSSAASLPAAVASIVAQRKQIRARMIALQEEIDWQVYGRFELVKSAALGETQLELGSRPFEVAIARGPKDSTDREWFRWNELEPREAFGTTWTAAEQDILESRTEARQKIGGLGLLESPECKRRWVQPAGKGAQWLLTDERVVAQQASDWVVAQTEEWACWRRGSVITAVTLRQESLKDTKVVAVRDWLADKPENPGTTHEQVVRDSVPFLAAYRFTLSGLEKYAAWQHTWDLQRKEDAGQSVDDVPVPPKYESTDFRKAEYWALRGKLDVPKERFISYPGCESAEDGEPVYGWAGWDHLQRAKALAELYRARKDDESWPKERLMPMLAGLLELMPWLMQWHNDPSDELGGMKPAEQFSLYLDAECAEHGFTHDDLRKWRPADKTSKAKAAKAKAAKKPSSDDDPDA
jgi:hypothetical protein